MRDILRNRRQDPIPRSGAAWSARGETPTDPPSSVTATSPTARPAAPLPVSAEAVERGRCRRIDGVGAPSGREAKRQGGHGAKR
jgi:hypothetical protein